MKHLCGFVAGVLCIFSLACGSGDGGDENRINRQEVVSRNNVQLNAVDTFGALSVGNGEFTMTVDVSGLQSFPEVYEDGIALGTQSQWGWHAFPPEKNYQTEDVAVLYESCNDRQIPYAIQHRDGYKGEATNWLRSNPHRLHLGMLGLILLRQDGSRAEINDLKDIEQTLDLWEGRIVSTYRVDDQPVRVQLVAHPDKDMVGFKIESPLVGQRRLQLSMRFPNGATCHVCPSYDFDSPDQHESRVIDTGDGNVRIERILDSTTYYVQTTTNQGSWKSETDHLFVLDSMSGDVVEGSMWFGQENEPIEDEFAAVEKASVNAWARYWSDGGIMDFSQCTDPRAIELERRVILSQYLTRIQCAGSLPPQETGLTSNSWYGKFHLEMHWWHGVHFPMWGHPELLEKSLPWYDDILPRAKAAAAWQGFEGVRWPKMTATDGRSSPSGVGEFLIWQQPHPIYFAELMYRQNPTRETLLKYQDIVMETAAFMASFAAFDSTDGRYHLCHPIIPAQEIFHATETDDPPFELAYWWFGLETSQLWRERMSMPRDTGIQHVLDNLAALPFSEGLYLPAARATEAYTDDDNRRDHPIVLGALGMLPKTPLVNEDIMDQTFTEVLKRWNWQTTWGWDYPMMAMTAARLGRGRDAIDALFMDAQKNTYLVNGHNYQDQRLKLYLPGNGAILIAVAMMAAGWENGPDMHNPGFPQDGTWDVRWEGLQKML